MAKRNVIRTFKETHIVFSKVERTDDGLKETIVGERTVDGSVSKERAYKIGRKEFPSEPIIVKEIKESSKKVKLSEKDFLKHGTIMEEDEQQKL